MIGEMKLINGKPEVTASNLLLEDDGEMNFKEIMNRNKQLMSTLFPNDSSKRIKLENKNQDFYETYEITVYDINCMFLTDISLLMSDLQLDNLDISDELKILHNFDLKIIYDTCKLEKSTEVCQARTYFEIGRIKFHVDKSKLPLLVDYYGNFMKNHSKMNEKYQLFKNTEEQFTLKNASLLETQRYQNPDSRGWKNDSQQDMRTDNFS